MTREEEEISQLKAALMSSWKGEQVAGLALQDERKAHKRTKDMLAAMQRDRDALAARVRELEGHGDRQMARMWSAFEKVAGGEE